MHFNSQNFSNDFSIWVNLLNNIHKYLLQIPSITEALLLQNLISVCLNIRI